LTSVPTSFKRTFPYMLLRGMRLILGSLGMLSHNSAVKREGRMLHFHTAQHKKQRQRLKVDIAKIARIWIIVALAQAMPRGLPPHPALQERRGTAGPLAFFLISIIKKNNRQTSQPSRPSSPNWLKDTLPSFIYTFLGA
jgi:hypothetical protein